MAELDHLEVAEDRRAPVVALRPVRTEIEAPLRQRLVLSAFRFAGQRRRVRRWVARQIAETDYDIAGPVSAPTSPPDGDDLRCWVLPERHAS
jgi:hypothetical protein